MSPPFTSTALPATSLPDATSTIVACVSATSTTTRPAAHALPNAPSTSEAPTKSLAVFMIDHGTHAGVCPPATKHSGTSAIQPETMRKEQRSKCFQPKWLGIAKFIIRCQYLSSHPPLRGSSVEELSALHRAGAGSIPAPE